jgi:UDP-N-acetylmuramoyl-tripeptide--D-alanyl-D-alanine ligase
MNELGEQSESLHEGVGKYAAGAGVDILVSIGEKGAGIATGFTAATKSAKAKKYRNNAEAVSALQKIIKDGDAVLVKGSRAMKTEEIIEALKEWRNGSMEGK